jgi:hypothetical protein
MTAPGVGVRVALVYVSVVDAPAGLVNGTAAGRTARVTRELRRK